MRCSKICIVLLLLGIGVAVLLASNGNAKAASLLSFLPFLACPLMCVVMHMFGKSCHGNECQKKPTQSSATAPHS